MIEDYFAAIAAQSSARWGSPAIFDVIPTFASAWSMDHSLARQKHAKVPPQDGRSAGARLMRRTREALALHWQLLTWG
jgi:hypothetical protein